MPFSERGGGHDGSIRRSWHKSDLLTVSARVPPSILKSADEVSTPDAKDACIEHDKNAALPTESRPRLITILDREHRGT